MSSTQVVDYFAELNNLLTNSGKVVAIGKEFGEIKENSERVKFLLKLYEEFDIKVEGKLKIEKNNAISKSCRTKGNQFYMKKQFLDALSSYNESLCFAEPGSKNIALAYANRSAVYCELKLYEKCLKNFELAKTNHYPNLDKLKEREEKCLLMINNTNNELSPSNVAIGADYLKLSHPANKKLPFIADCLELKTDKDFGRHIITKTALKPGDVVCSEEEPFMKFLLPSHRFKYCATCLNDNSLDLFPCSDCTSAMFCSEECERIGQEKFHKFECPIIDKLNVDCCEERKTLRTFFEALDVCGGNLEELKALIDENQDSSMTIFDYTNPLEAKTVLKAIDALSTNERKYNQAEMFQRTGVVAIICDLFLKHTKLREILVTRSDEDFFYSFFLKHSQIRYINYHGLHNGVINKCEEGANPQYGAGIFPFCSLFNHSCAPNVFRLTSDCKSFIIIVRPIPAGGQLFDSYGPRHRFQTLQQRQFTLASQYKFKCSCDACEGNYPHREHLQNKDPFFMMTIPNDYDNLNLYLAKKNFKLYCDYLKRMDRKYPSAEINYVLDCFEQCFRIFAMSDFKLKIYEL